MTEEGKATSRRQAELLEAAYGYVLEHGLADMSLRPLATAIGSSPRVLLYLYGSKDGLIKALLARARADELDLLALLDAPADAHARPDLAATITILWTWLSAPEHRNLLALWVEAYARSLIDPNGPWSDFAAGTVRDWLAILGRAQSGPERATAAGLAERTLALATLRGALLDLLATGDRSRTTAAITHQVRMVAASGGAGDG